MSTEEKPPTPPEPPFNFPPDFRMPPLPPGFPPSGFAPRTEIEAALRGVFGEALNKVRAESAAKKAEKEREKNKVFLYRLAFFVGSCAGISWAFHVSPLRGMVFGVCFIVGLGAMTSIAKDV